MDIINEQFRSVGVWLSAGAVLATVTVSEHLKVILISAAFGGLGGVFYALGLGEALSVLDLGTAVGIGFVGAGAVAAWLTLYFPGLCDRVRRPLNFRGSDTSVDAARRWSVSAFAATGAAAGGVFGLPEFWKAAVEHVSLANFLLALLITPFSALILRPLHEFVLEGAKLADHVSLHHTLKHIKEHGTWRTYARIGLIFVGLVVLEFIALSLHYTVTHNKGLATLVILDSALRAGVVSYFWCAALQSEAPLLRGAVWPTVLIGAVLLFPATLAPIFEALHDPQKFTSMASATSYARTLATGLISLIAATPLTLVTSAIAFGLPSLAGAAALASKRRHLVSIALCLLVAAGAQLLVYAALFESLAARLDPIYMVSQVTNVLGWIAGLAMSEFMRMRPDRRGNSASET